MRWLLVLTLLLTACSSAPEPAPRPPEERLTELSTVTQLIPLDAVDELTLPDELARAIDSARGRIPERVDPKQLRALEDLESRYERLEAELEGEAMGRDRGRLLGAYYWERLRIFAPDLAEETPDAMLSAFERATGRGD